MWDKMKVKNTKAIDWIASIKQLISGQHIGLLARIEQC